MRRRRRLRVLGLLAGMLLPWTAQAGFGFGFDSDNGFYDYDPEDYARWGYPPPGYRDYNPRWRWGSGDRDGTWRWGGDRGHSPDARRRGKGKQGRWDKRWTFGDWDDDTTRFSFGPQRFHFGDRWTPSWNDSWGKRRYRYPAYPRYPVHPSWGRQFPPPNWGAPARPWWPRRPGRPGEGMRHAPESQAAPAEPAVQASPMTAPATSGTASAPGTAAPSARPVEKPEKSEKPAPAQRQREEKAEPAPERKATETTPQAA